MKIALCLSGQMRSMEYCIESINTAFPNCEIDVFATVWDYENEDNIKVLKEKLNVVFLDRVSNNQLEKYKNFEEEAIKRGFESIETVENWAPLPVWNLTRIELMAQNSFKSTLINDYDFIVRLRYDTKFLKNIVPELEDGKILLSEDIGGSAPWDTWKDTRSVYDGFAAGNVKDMQKYYNFVDWLPEYFQDHHETLKAERTLGWYLSKHADVKLKFTKDILGLQINENEWYNRSNPTKTNSLKDKQKGTFDFYQDDLRRNHEGLYITTIKHKFIPKFSIRCAQRSGSNFLEQLIVQNIDNLHCIQADKDKSNWKHGDYYSNFNDGKEFTCLIARNPLKWVNGCVKFNADMWKWWKVNAKPGTPEELVFYYHDRRVSIPKMVAKWNEFYSKWLKDQNIYFVWYSDLLDESTRRNVMNNLSNKFKYSIKNQELVIPTKVIHSDEYNEQKKAEELDLSSYPNLTQVQIEYIKEHIDKNLINTMSERREYENSSSIQW